eukprot:82242-Pelagomonas_calceolata.AAC.2
MLKHLSETLAGRLKHTTSINKVLTGEQLHSSLRMIRLLTIAMRQCAHGVEYGSVNTIKRGGKQGGFAAFLKEEHECANCAEALDIVRKMDGEQAAASAEQNFQPSK